MRSMSIVRTNLSCLALLVILVFFSATDLTLDLRMIKKVDHHASGCSDLCNVCFTYQSCQLDMILNTLILSGIIGNNRMYNVLQRLVVRVSPYCCIQQIDWRLLVQASTVDPLLVLSLNPQISLQTIKLEVTLVLMSLLLRTLAEMHSSWLCRERCRICRHDDAPARYMSRRHKPG